jgi:predicted transcriptional regulator
MRHAIRIQPYLSQDLFRKLRAYAAARSLTVSAVVADALGEYLERDEVEDAVIVRRLDSLNEAVELLRRDVDTLAVGFGRFVRYSFFSAPLAIDDKAIKRAEALYHDFLGKVGEQFRAGVRFTLQVFPTHRLGPAAASLTTAEGDGREESERP